MHFQVKQKLDIYKFSIHAAAGAEYPSSAVTSLVQAVYKNVAHFSKTVYWTADDAKHSLHPPSKQYDSQHRTSNLKPATVKVVVTF